MQVLVVDLDRDNLELINNHLQGEDINLTVANGAQHGFDLLLEKKGAFEAIIFHHVSKSLDSINFITQLRTNNKFRTLPVIVVGTEKEEITSIIKSGAYYFVVMPCSKDLLIALLETASEDKKRYNNVAYKGKNICEICPKITSLELTLKTMEEMSKAATFLSSFYPDPLRVMIGISELLINAIEHGNLGIDCNQKAKLLKDRTLSKEIKKRMVLPENMRKKVYLKLLRTKEYICLIVKDDGEGFEWKKYMNSEMLSSKEFHGRGIAFANTVSFDKLEYNHTGNEVKAYVCLDDLTKTE